MFLKKNSKVDSDIMKFNLVALYQFEKLFKMKYTLGNLLIDVRRLHSCKLRKKILLKKTKI